MTTPVTHQTFQPMPKLDSPMVNEDGTVALPWYYFFVRIWQAIGGGNLSFQNIGILQSAGGSAPIQVLSPGGNLVATFQSGAFNPQETYLQIASPGQTEQQLTPGANPFYYTASQSGTILVDGNSLTLRVTRSNGLYYRAALNVGNIHLRKNDQVSVAWVGNAPNIIWYPD